MWFTLPAIAIANGAIRDGTYGRRLDRDVAHSISVVPLCIAIICCARVAARRWPLSGPRAAVRVGLCWLALTLLFEFSIGAIQGVSVREMLAEYNVLRGRLWAVVPLTTVAAPVIALDRDA